MPPRTGDARSSAAAGRSATVASSTRVYLISGEEATTFASRLEHAPPPCTAIAVLRFSERRPRPLRCGGLLRHARLALKGEAPAFVARMSSGPGSTRPRRGPGPTEPWPRNPAAIEVSPDGGVVATPSVKGPHSARPGLIRARWGGSVRGR
jgi:hypothetical protein